MIRPDAAAGLLVSADDVQVRGNTIIENGANGMNAHRSGNLTVEQNQLVRNNTELLGFSGGYDLEAGGLMATHVTNAIIRDNVVKASQGNGISCDLSCRG